jgi:hypothetical protein
MTIRPATNKGNRETTFYVMGDSGREYIIHHKRNLVSHRRVWTCNCPDFTERRQFNGTFCKHIVEVQVDQAKQALLNAAVATQASAVATPSGTKQMLDSIISFLNNAPYEESRQLWDVLTALRGPDDNNTSLKSITTARIRGVLGLRPNGAAGAVVDDGVPIHNDASGYDMFYKLKETVDNTVSYHFAKHYAYAVATLRALGYIK